MWTYQSYQKRKTTVGWPCLEELKSTATCNDRTESCGKGTLGKTKDELKIKKDIELFGVGDNWINLALDREGLSLGCETVLRTQ